MPGQYFVLSIQDTGHGMSCEVMERIYDPYFTTKDHGERTGMGLSVAQGIVHSMRGTITVDSPDVGSAFSVYLPVTVIETAPRLYHFCYHRRHGSLPSPDQAYDGTPS
jgi:signal transduction histidine kinase